MASRHESAHVADRVMHVNLNVRSADRSEAFYSEVFGLTVRAVTDGAPFDGQQLQLPGMVSNDCRLMYDWRGPRSSPSVEIMEWRRPPPIGTPHPGLSAPGIQAIAFEVDDLGSVRRRIEAAGGSVLGTGPSCVLPEAAEAVTILDPDGVRVEVSEYSRLARRPPTFRGLALTTMEPESSYRFYTQVGFQDYVARTSPDVIRGVLGTTEAAPVRRLSSPEDVPPFCLALCTVTGPGTGEQGYPSANHVGLFRMALRVDNVRAAIDEVSPLGISVRGPYPVQLTGTRIEPLMIGFMTDPNGVVVEFVERHRKHFRPSGTPGAAERGAADA